jgi:hypothetical protein
MFHIHLIFFSLAPKTISLGLRNHERQGMIGNTKIFIVGCSFTIVRSHEDPYKMRQTRYSLSNKNSVSFKVERYFDICLLVTKM